MDEMTGPSRLLWLGLVLWPMSALGQTIQIDKSANAALPLCLKMLRLLDNRATLLTTGEAWEAGYCTGMVRSTLQMAVSLNITCYPKTVTGEQAVRVTIDYIRRHPSRTNEDFEILALEAFKEAWPCKPQ